MAPSKLRKAIGAVKDQTSISLAKVSGSASISDLEVAIVKATRHEEYPPEERHIREILCLTLYSRAYVGACVVTISRRLSKTKNWVVALKSLMLVHRLLANGGEQSYEQEIFFATRRGTRLLNMSDFRDSRSNFWDYSAFVRTYSLYLDEQVELRMQNRRGKHSALASGNEEGVEEEDEEEETGNTTAIVVTGTPITEMKNEYLYSRIQHYIQILDRFLACKPTGAAKRNRLVLVALYQVVKESFQVYYSIAEMLGILVDRFMKLDIPDSKKVHEIFHRVAKQWDELEVFYTWSKAAGISRLSEYPDVENYPKQKLDIMEEIIREKMEMAGGRIMRSREPSPEVEEVEEPEPEAEAEEDMNTIKALPPPPEDFIEEMAVVEAPTEEKKEQDIGDLLNLGEDAPTPEEHANQLALALFDGIPTIDPTKTTITTPWEAFNGSEDWETALVQTASHLSNQKAQFPGNFDELMLDGMYRQGALNQAVASSGVLTTGSATSVAFGSAGRPAMLALPAPPSSADANTTASGADPFAASLSVAPPAYVQMSELEKKQRLLWEEQQMWQQYTKDGMHGQVGLEKAQQSSQPHNYYGY
ncbi:PREDICTED: putative clathrin assembly protein At1g03050 [Ipomoea nil]|uniref:putative clathrin assembly protein At1g03050 n=1 Tax=Ipomoea nil TaxID=35883 RepID=UPI0009010FF8|nr:PREDICTED: putative clathrin assembly protein At1g03050 [Ipomoea nil]XP_019169760.1 PREDICTED: putative clathrin assembly protein At1g03050 [Ipomoea nil]